MTLILELSAEEETRLAEAAKLHGTDPTSYAKQLVTSHLPEPIAEGASQGDFGGQSLYEMFGDLFGTVDNLPSDLSTNPDHMRGFGETNASRV